MAVNINELTDEQKSWATLLPYLQINEEGREKLERGETIKLSEFEQYLEGPDEIWSKRGEILAQMGDASLVNEDAFLTRRELLDKFNEMGLGDLELKDFSEEKGVLTTGFQACAFQDSQGQSAVVFRGSDFDFSHGAIDD